MIARLRGVPVGLDVQGDGVPVLLMHAFPLDRSMFRPIPGARLITFDAPGMGDSGLPEGPVSLDDIAALEADLLDHLGIARAVVGGVSMGGYTALRFAARFPGRLLGLIICDSRAEGDDEPRRRARQEMIEAGRRDGPAEVARRMLPRLLGETTRRENPALVDAVRAKIESASVEGIVRLLEALANRADSTGVLSQIAAPTLVVVGEEDSISTPSDCREMASRIPGARLVVVPRAGHLPPLEQPELFEAAVRELL